MGKRDFWCASRRSHSLNATILGGDRGGLSVHKNRTTAKRLDVVIGDYDLRVPARRIP